jgi:hypothetical protein
VRTGHDNRIRKPRRTRASRSHSRVVGLRARLKTERFWFDSRGWHVPRRRMRRPPRHCLRSSKQSSRFLPGSVLVRVQPEAPSRARPTGEAAVFQAVPGEFDSRSPLAGSIQAARSTSCSSSRQGTRSLTPDNTGSTPVHDTCTAPSSNGSGSEITNLRMVVRVHPESLSQAAIWDHIGFQVRSAGFDSSTACDTASSSPGGEIGFIRRTGRVRSPGLLRPRRAVTWG